MVDITATINSITKLTEPIGRLNDSIDAVTGTFQKAGQMAERMEAWKDNAKIIERENAIRKKMGKDLQGSAKLQLQAAKTTTKEQLKYMKLSAKAREAEIRQIRWRLMTEKNFTKRQLETASKRIQALKLEKEEILASRKELKELSSVTRSVGKKFKEISDGKIGKAFKVFFAKLAAVLGGASIGSAIITILNSSDAAFKSIAKSMGTSISGAREVTGNFVNSIQALVRLGASMEDIVGSTTALIDASGSVNFANEKNIQTVTKLNKAFGLSNEEAASLVKTMQYGFGMTAKQTEDFANNLRKDAYTGGVSVGIVMRDIQRATENTTFALNKSPEDLKKMAIRARQLGSNLENVDKLGETFGDFETSISTSTKLAAAFGVQMNAFEMTRLAQMGEEEKIQEKLTNDLSRKLVKNNGELVKLTRVQKNELRSLLGDDYPKMLKTTQMMNKLGQAGVKNEEQRAAIADYLVSNNKKFNKQNVTAAKEIIRKREEQLKKEETLDDVIKGQMTFFEDIKGMVSGPIIQAISELNKRFFETDGIGSKVKKKLEEWLPSGKDMVGYFDKAVNFLSAMYNNYMVPIGQWISGVWTQYGDTITGLFDRLGTLAKEHPWLAAMAAGAAAVAIDIGESRLGTSENPMYVQAAGGFFKGIIGTISTLISAITGAIAIQKAASFVTGGRLDLAKSATSVAGRAVGGAQGELIKKGGTRFSEFAKGGVIKQSKQAVGFLGDLGKAAAKLPKVGKFIKIFGAIGAAGAGIAAGQMTGGNALDVVKDGLGGPKGIAGLIGDIAGGIAGGAAAGAALGTLGAGPIGAAAGTVLGGILGGIFGEQFAQAIWGYVDVAIEWTKNTWNKISTAFSPAIENIKEIFRLIGVIWENRVVTPVSNFWKSVKSTFDEEIIKPGKALWGSVKSTFDDLWESAKPFVGQLVNIIAQFNPAVIAFKAMVDLGKKAFDSFMSWFGGSDKSVLDSAGETAAEWTGDLKNWLTEAAQPNALGGVYLAAQGLKVPERGIKANRATLAMVGEENRDEIVIPTERLRKGLPVDPTVAAELASIGVPGYFDGATFGKAGGGASFDARGVAAATASVEAASVGLMNSAGDISMREERLGRAIDEQTAAWKRQSNIQLQINKLEIKKEQQNKVQVGKMLEMIGKGLEASESHIKSNEQAFRQSGAIGNFLADNASLMGDVGQILQAKDKKEAATNFALDILGKKLENLSLNIGGGPSGPDTSGISGAISQAIATDLGKGLQEYAKLVNAGMDKNTAGMAALGNSLLSEKTSREAGNAKIQAAQDKYAKMQENLMAVTGQSAEQAQKALDEELAKTDEGRALLADKNKEKQADPTGLGDRFKEGVGGIAQSAALMMQSGASMKDAALSALKQKAMDMAKEKATKVLQGAAGAVPVIGPILQSLVPIIVEFLPQVLKWLSKHWKEIPKMIFKFFVKIRQFMFKAFMFINKLPFILIKKIISIMKKVPGAIFRAIKNMVKSILPFAEGGIIRQPTIAAIGETGEKEMVVPIDRIRNGGTVNPEVMSELRGLTPYLGQTGTTNTTTTNNTTASNEALIAEIRALRGEIAAMANRPIEVKMDGRKVARAVGQQFQEISNGY